MPGVLDDAILSGVANANFKTNAELGSQLLLGHVQRTNLLAEASLAAQLHKLNEQEPLTVNEAQAIKTAQTANAQSEGAMSAALGVALAQQLMKGAGSTPPVSITGAGP